MAKKKNEEKKNRWFHHIVFSVRTQINTEAELDEVMSDPDAMRIQALIIRERILGPAHPDTSYFIRYRGAVYADAGEFHPHYYGIWTPFHVWFSS